MHCICIEKRPLRKWNDLLYLSYDLYLKNHIKGKAQVLFLNIAAHSSLDNIVYVSGAAFEIILNCC